MGKADVAATQPGAGSMLKIWWTWAAASAAALCVLQVIVVAALTGVRSLYPLLYVPTTTPYVALMPSLFVQGLVSGALLGVLMGVAQATALWWLSRPRGLAPLRWGVATVGGFALGEATSVALHAILTFQSDPFGAPFLPYAVAGVLSGVADGSVRGGIQWCALRRCVPRAWLWVLACALARPAILIVHGALGPGALWAPGAVRTYDLLPQLAHMGYALAETTVLALVMAFLLTSSESVRVSLRGRAPRAFAGSQG